MNIDLEATKEAQRQQLNAERTRRATVAEAEGQKQSIELKAEADFYKAKKEAEAVKVAADAEAYSVEIKAQADSLLLELVGNRALYDFLVVCDESNNTPARIDRNELYLDIAIEPVKAVEFIYIPLRLKNTGEIAGL